MVTAKEKLTLNYNKAIFLFKNYPWPNSDGLKYSDCFKDF